MRDTKIRKMEDKNRIIIFDTTMRDGEQSPGASMSLEEKIQSRRDSISKLKELRKIKRDSLLRIKRNNLKSK